jgi:outer membrane protein, multidrug efflux system
VNRAGLIAATLLLIAASGCTVGPRYSRPAAPTPAPDAWKTQPPWEQAAPKDAIPKGVWWQVYHDPTLDGYEQQLLQANQSLIAAVDRLNQARSLARVATADFFPQLSTDPGAVRERGAGNRPLNGEQTIVNGVRQTIPPYTQNVFTIPFSLSYEVDLFGRVRRNVEAANASLQASAADLQNVQLVLTAELAADYFSLRELDAEYNVVEESVGYQRKGLDLVESRHNGGIASGLEVAQQATVLDSTISQLSLVQQSREQYEHAIAALLGQPASSFTIPSSPLNATPPPVPLGVPSDILERRPDVATAERQMAYENAEVGLARTAFYPHITISNTGGGWQSTSVANILNAPSLFWSIGADALQPIVQGGRIRANYAAAKAAYDESVANYRQSVLTAFQQAEDGISNLSTVAQALTTQGKAVADAKRALDIATNRYVGGVTNYLDVITAQTTLLSNQRLETQLLGQQMVSSVYLIKALGGSWDASQIQNERVHANPGQIVQQ